MLGSVNYMRKYLTNELKAYKLLDELNLLYLQHHIETISKSKRSWIIQIIQIIQISIFETGFF